MSNSEFALVLARMAALIITFSLAIRISFWILTGQ